ncbi:hypothetical protein ABZ725_29440 [Streptomyces sp. NPDC006872]|uniref:hypothetical protein n=1 Tax=Streptomyces sp. NPDC006872 TaxID=3155720 RepID=UPI003404D01E
MLLDLVHADVDRRRIPVHVLLDIVHVGEYLWTASQAFHPSGTSDAEAWVAGRPVLDRRARLRRRGRGRERRGRGEDERRHVPEAAPA